MSLIACFKKPATYVAATAMAVSAVFTNVTETGNFSVSTAEAGAKLSNNCSNKLEEFKQYQSKGHHSFAASESGKTCTWSRDGYSSKGKANKDALNRCYTRVRATGGGSMKCRIVL